jgi:catechol 2,3-dioxygenase-like lactoylglutathione lyase family enzyme
MTIRNIDHLTITTHDLESCLRFYVDILGMEHRVANGHHNLHFSGGKISIHTRKGEFQPAAEHPEYGSQDFCLIVDTDLKTLKEELERKDVQPLTDIVNRTGAHGPMQSLYLRDPDGNLVELSNY